MRSGIVAAVLGIVAIAFPLIAGEGYLTHIVINALIFSMLASSLNLMLGYAGLVSIAHAAFFGIGAYAAALLTVRGGVPFGVALGGAAVVAAVVALAIGIPSFRTRGIYYIIVTVAFQLIVSEAFDNWDTVTGGGLGLKGIPRPSALPFLPHATFETKAAYYYVVLLVSVAVHFLLVRLVRSPIGRALIALRDNETKAAMMGIDGVWYKTLALAVGAGIAGLAGGLYVHYLGFAHPEFFTFAVSVDIFLSVILGGAGTMYGPIFGVVVLEVMRETLHGFVALRLLLFGVLLIVIIVFLPRGLLPPVIAAAKRLMTRGAPRSASPEAASP
jgi:branched-chain amino acid transport system permease protein